jgi:predicted dehydrogenase
MKANMDPSPAAGESRRAFLGKAAKAAAAAGALNLINTSVYGQSQAPSANVLGANERLRVACIGAGSRGSEHLRLLKEHADELNIVPVAVCDVYEKRLDAARRWVDSPGAAFVAEHRKVMERKDVDAVIVCTVDHWHAPVAIDALQAGKHVYCEKPMTRYLAEAFAVHDTVKQSGKVFMVGSQGCADPKWHKAAEWIRAGKLGPLVWGQGSYCRNNPKNSEWTYPIDPEASERNLDWKRWLGKTPAIPFNPEHYFCWHKYYAYNSGLIGNLLPHRLHPLMLATGQPEFPRRVVATGTRKISTDREITDTTHLLAEFPSGLTLVAAGSTVNEQGLPDVLRGRRATLHFASSQNHVELRPERIFADEMEGEEFSDPLPAERTERLQKNFFDCIRSGGQPFAGIDLAIRVQTVLCMAEMSERLGLALFFDEATRTLRTGDGRIVPPLTYGSVVPGAS